METIPELECEGDDCRNETPPKRIPHGRYGNRCKRCRKIFCDDCWPIHNDQVHGGTEAPAPWRS